jgi:hypothetical protein
MLVSDKLEIEGASAKILHPGCRTLFRYWESLRAERPCPRRDEINLKSIVDIVPYLTIIEHISGVDPWRFRLTGTKVCEIFGRTMTNGNALSGWETFERKVVGNCLELSLTRLQPSLVRMRFISEHSDVLAAEMIAMPIHNGAQNAVTIFGGIFPFPSEKTGHQRSYPKRELVSARMIWTEHGVGDQLVDAVGRSAQTRFRVIQGGLG